tara:strand:+ start:1096 stop:1341 length:246 start_codon:yes stop_codon:yes gene_type:complete
MKWKFDCLALGYSVSLFSALVMLLMGIFGNLGLYLNGVEAMAQWHVFFSLSIVGILSGILEGAIIGFVIGYSIGLFYNKFS